MKPEFAIFTAAGCSEAGLIRLLTNGARKGTCRPALHTGDVDAVKSPASIAGVGTKARTPASAERSSPDTRRRRRACL